ncbi:MAG: hypothetical protein LAO21_10535 [Acidobacteriia bacterium]|nr:hypothetical protein [Terriglobia bacterium]
MKKNVLLLSPMTVLTSLIILTVVSWAAEAWKAKKYTEWTDPEAMQVLERSPWGSIVSVVTGASPVASDPGTAPGGRDTSPISDTGRTEEYTVAWYSALPVRQAHARLAELRGRATKEQLEQFLQPVTDVCLIAVRGRNQDRLIKANKDQLLKKTYLQVKGKEKVFASDYTAPSTPTAQAIFQFPRTVNGTPILSEDDKDVEFVTDLGEYRVRSHFTPKKMIFDGRFTF